MSRFRRRQIIVATLCFCLTTPLWAAFPSTAAPQPPTRPQGTSQLPGPSQPAANEEFKFGNVDLELLEQVNLLDRRFDREGLVLEDEATNAYLKRVGEVLLPRGLKLEHVSWRFRVLRDSAPNALALPNGSIYVTTGLLALMDNESQVASVIAHEMTHVIRRHSYLQNRSNRKKFLTMNIMAAVGQYAPGGIVGAVITVATAVAPFIVLATMFGYSRDLEREADLKGIDMMIAAEYPPEEMVKMMKVLNQDIEGEEIRYFYNDHPALHERINYLSSYLGARADKVTAQMELNREKNAYFTKAESIMRHDIQLAINAARFRSAVYLAQRLVESRPNSSENVFLLAEAYRNLGPRSPQLTEKESTNSAKKDAAKKRAKRTPDEEERDLLATTAGQQNWKTHQQKAEELYQRAANLENPFPAVYRGRGMLYEKLGRPSEAVTEYEKYLELAPGAIDRERIQRRIEALRRSQT
ncbi:MAG: M48 family metalloprotease [Acidobacteriota bacterium]